MQEDYPAPAWDALLHMVDSHDTTRILWTLTPATENEAAKAAPDALAEGKVRQAMLATIQLTFPGMASIYYGDEVGLTGHDDPDDRRPYPWDAEDAAVLRHLPVAGAAARAERGAARGGPDVPGCGRCRRHARLPPSRGRRRPR